MERVQSQRRWSSSGVQDMRISRPTTASLRQHNSSSSRPVSSFNSRPVSSFSHRPVSGFGNRPVGRTQSRPTTALAAPQKPAPLFLQEPRPESSAQATSRLRPSSAIRPLSGRVFIRKTQGKGWVARGLPEVSYDSLEIEDYSDEYSETQSLDSFFDDDFDTEEQDEKLQRLLTCTTLGVASRGQKQDYVPGEIHLPKFHCSRCRDHYYGLTPYPCDEELARLIREGLWRTGERTFDKSIQHGMMRTSLSESNVRRTGGKDGEPSSSGIKLPPLSGDMTSLNSSAQEGKDSSTSANISGKKKTKKISFALDHDDMSSALTSETDLSQDAADIGNPGRKRRVRDENKRGNWLPTGLSNSNENSTDSISSLDKYGLGAQKKSDNQSSTSKLLGSQTELGALKGRGQKGNRLSSSNSSDKDSSTGNNKSGSTFDDDTTNASGLGSQTGIDGNSSTMLSSGTSNKPENGLTNSAASGVAGVSNKNGVNAVDSLYGSFNSNDDNGTGNSIGSGGHGESTGDKDCNVVNCQNRINPKAKNRAGVDSVKKSHKAPPGYMRAASPSQSDWGDPTHAKKWINSVVPPPPTFRYNNNDDDDEFSGQLTFNPHRWRQPKKPAKPDTDDSLLLPVGPTFTRAFTFSYMPAINAGNSATSLSKKSLRKTN